MARPDADRHRRRRPDRDAASSARARGRAITTEEIMADQDRNGGPDNQRRRLLQGGLGAAALGTIPGAGQLAANAQGAFDWKKFKGEKIEVFLVKSPRGDLLTKYHKEFEDLTGITVGSEMIPEQQQRQKAVIE